MLATCCLLLAVPVLAAAPDTGAPSTDSSVKIKKYRFEIRPIDYKGKLGADPFMPGVPLRAEAAGKTWKVRISTLKLSSVIMGKQKVAVFKESIGPIYSYILVNGILVGPDHKPIPGIEGSIEPMAKKGEYRVILRQGVDSVVHTLLDEDAKYRKASEPSGAASSGTDRTGISVGGSE